ncbi:uncharacterized protein ATNIH1004_002110 [Aspergillus tanneri]|nr:uncharacterized protein ATNIH1004_002110 [Aspergillus tanneri]KAA8649439.1 hypothetical protein ATNIH1004_002110 [Aspergillus tanneri]
MPVHVEPITQADVPRMVDIQQVAMQASAFFRSIGDVPNTDGFTTGITEPPCRINKITRILNDWNKDPTVRFLKAVDTDSDEMIAFAQWHVYHGDEGLEEWRESVRTDKEMRIPFGANKEGYQFCQSHLFERRKMVFGQDGREHCLLALLATDPQFERRGAASALTQWGCDVADQLGIECYVESSKKGYP